MIVVSDDFVALVDGATDKSGERCFGRTGGRYAALTVAAAFDDLDSGSTISDAVGVASMTMVVPSCAPTG